MVALMQARGVAWCRSKAASFFTTTKRLVQRALRWSLEKWRVLRAEPWPQLRSRLLLAFAVIAISVFWGFATVFLEVNALILVASILASIFILTDYRVGVILLILFMPISASTIFPHEMLGLKGANPLNLLIFTTLSAYALRRIFVKTSYRLVPRTWLWYFIIPVVLAGLHGAPHFSEIPAFFSATGLLSFEGSGGYLRDMVAKPLFLVIFALMVAAASHSLSRPQWLLIPTLVSIWVMSLMVIIFFLLSGAHFGDLANPHARGFLSPLGMNPNDLGRLYATAYALLLYSLRGAPTGFIRIVILVSMALVCVSLALTFSRAAFLAFVVINVVYFIMQRNFKAIALGFVFVLVIAFALPGAIYERVSLGFGANADTNEISAGRTADIWQPLLPEIVKSPLIGYGLGSTMWSAPMLSGTMMQVGHPHNAYLKAALDMGLAGLLLLAIFYRRSWQLLRELRQRTDLDLQLRYFFEGASIGLLAFLVVGMSGSSLDPVAEQAFLWLAFGMAYGVAAKPAVPT